MPQMLDDIPKTEQVSIYGSNKNQQKFGDRC